MQQRRRESLWDEDDDEFMATYDGRSEGGSHLHGNSLRQVRVLVKDVGQQIIT